MYSDYASAVLADSPWGFWEELETSGTTLADSSGNSRTATINGTPPPALNQSGPVSDSKAISWPNLATYAITAGATHATSPATLETWVYLTAYPSALTMIMGGSLGYNGSTNDKDLHIDSTGHVQWYLFSGGQKFLTATNPIPLNTWCHVVGSIGAAGMKLRINKALAVATNAAITDSYVAIAQNILLRGSEPSATGTGAMITTGQAFYTSQLSDARTDAHYDAMASGAALDVGSPTAISLNGGVGLSWTAGFPAATSYDYRVNGGSPTNTTSLSVLIIGLTNGTAYTFEVRAADTPGPWHSVSSAPVASVVAPVPQASSSTYSTYPLSNMVDGDLTTWWWSNGAPVSGSYFGVDLGSAQAVYGITIAMGNGDSDYIQSGQIRYSLDGVAWSNLSSSTDAVVTDSTPVPARYVRYYSLALNPSWCKVREFTVITGAPVAPAVQAFGLPAAIVLTWASVAGATTYEYRVNGGTPVTGLTGTGATITGLTNGTSYTVELRGANLAGSSPWSTLVKATPTTSILLYDDFNRADSAISAGSPVQGGPYTVVSGTWGISGNQLYTPGAVAQVLTFPAAVDVDFSLRIGVTNVSGGPVIRYVDANNYIYLGWSGTAGTLAIASCIAGVQTILVTTTFNPGDTVRLVALGPRLSLYVNGVLRGTCDDLRYSAATTVAGFRFSTSATIQRLDNAYVVPAAQQTLVGAIKESKIPATLAPSDTFLYKGRDTRTADAGSSVA